jgi:hypothetical protein
LLGHSGPFSNGAIFGLRRGQGERYPALECVCSFLLNYWSVGDCLMAHTRCCVKNGNVMLSRDALVLIGAVSSAELRFARWVIVGRPRIL